MPEPKPTWQVLIEDKRARQATTIPSQWRISPSRLPPSTQLDVTSFPSQCGLLTPRELEITETTDVNLILEKLRNGVWSAVDVTRAFGKRAVVAHQVVNCLTEVFIERALARAAELDEYLKKTGKVVGPLHGLPISLKDQLRVKGLETTMGYVSWIGQYAERNSVLVDILLDCGAVPFVQTNVPQTLMWPETYNLIFGRTTNPRNRTLTSGGSSGGEGALVAMRGSPIGVGSDIGGSIRIPSTFNGLYALRPSSHRLPYAHARNSMLGQESVPSVFGPLTNSLENIKIFMKVILDKEGQGKPWDRDEGCVRLPWDEDAYNLRDHGRHRRKLRFGLCWDNGEVVPHPPVRRAMEMVRDALVDSGHFVVDWEPYKHAELCSVFGQILDAGAQDDYAATTAPTGEPILESMADYVFSSPSSEPSLLSEDVDRATANSLFTSSNPSTPSDSDSSTATSPTTTLTTPAPTAETETSNFRPSSSSNKKKVTAYELWELHRRKRELKQEYLERWVRVGTTTRDGVYGQGVVEGREAGKVDAIISPCAPYGAPPHGMNRDASYTMVWNVLDYPACVFPVTTVDPILDTKRERKEYLGERDRRNWELYDPQTFLNAPIGLQLVARTQEDEAVIGMTEVVDEALKMWKAKNRIRGQPSNIEAKL
ncbi:general amidase [Panus rudis PR-1116 ss-1]|nr:general amidase [Panus rudis PR-1116 ss-1]